MTKEQIAELRQGAQTYVAQVRAMAFTAGSGTEASIYLGAADQPEMMLRALDEREALLEALRKHGVHLKPCFGRCECGLDEVFRKAES